MSSTIGAHRTVGLTHSGRAAGTEPPARRPGDAPREDVSGTERARAGAGSDPLNGQPPRDADPRLWALLSRAERDFYFRNATFGALTYGPTSGAGTAPEPAGRRLGGRIDLTA